MHRNGKKIRISNKQTIIIGIIFLFISLLLHEMTLYPFQNTPDTLRVTLLRLFLLMAPLFLGFKISKIKPWNLLKTALFVAWIVLIPYTIYSIAEIRHIAEICRLPDGGIYTKQCVQNAWTLAPTFIYAFAGTMIFVFSLIQVSEKIFKYSLQKQLFIAGICLMSAFATVYGLYTRVNIWDTALQPVASFQKLTTIITKPDFLLNSLLFTMFFLGITFITNRIQKHAVQQ